MSYVVVVHIGAGYHSINRESLYRSVIKEACYAAGEVLSQGADAIAGVSEAIRHLENSGCTNAGIGSNLTYDGTVECDASIMSENNGFGAVGAVSGVRNPILIAEKLLREERKGRLSLGRVRPLFLVAEGAKEWAREHGLSDILCNDSDMVSAASKRAWVEYRSRVEEDDDNINGLALNRKRRRSGNGDDDATTRTATPPSNLDVDSLMDTVGAICVDKLGRVSAGVSSGGIVLKHKGRIGEAAMYGSGCWAETSEQKKVIKKVGVSVTGTGEQIMKSMTASETAKQLLIGQRKAINERDKRKEEEEEEEDEKEEQEEEEEYEMTVKQVLESIINNDLSEKKHVGLISVVQKREVLDIVYGHTTKSMGVGWLTSQSVSSSSSHKTSYHVDISRLSDPDSDGKSIALGGATIAMFSEASN